MKENAETARWSLRYQTALRKQLEQRHGPSQRLVQSLGRQAVALGLETLDLAKTHVQALATLISPSDSSKTRESRIKRAKDFFNEAAIRIEKTHRAALEADALIRQLNLRLTLRAKESVASNRLLKKSVVQRKRAEAALKSSGNRHRKLLGEANRVLKHLRHLTRACLSAQEDDWKSVSHHLNNDLAQGLLGLHVRLLTFEEAMKGSAKKLVKKIGGTERLVRESARNVKRFAHECRTDEKKA